MKQIADIRRANLRRVVSELGGPTAVAKRLKLSGPSWITQLISGHREFTEKTARKFERGLGFPQGYFDRPSDEDSGFSPITVNREVPQVSQTISVIQSLLTSRGQKLTNMKFGQVVDAVFSQVMKTGKVDPELVEKILDLLT